MRLLTSLLCLIIALSSAGFGQASCTPVALSQPKDSIFTAQQEVELGNLIAEFLRDGSYVVEDPSLTANLQRIGDRVAKQLPHSDLQYRFYVADEPIPNAWAVAGGRIYVTRKLIGFVHNEDELAGVLAHELGHVATHQTALTFSRLFREAFGANAQISNEADLRDKFHRALESRKKVRDDAEDHQFVADRVGVETLARAGYNVQALGDFYDRLTNNKGRRGNWLSDLVGHTNMDSKRFREMAKQVESLPSACIARRPAEFSASDFHAWQRSVVAYSGMTRPEKLPDHVARLTLDPPLQDELHTLRFSPDGKFVIAQDQTSIYVLTREPFQQVLRIDAPDAYPAKFTADSKVLSFYTPSLRVEQWDMATLSQIGAHELASIRECMQTALSADGRTLACIDSRNDLTLFDTESGDRAYEKKNIRDVQVDLTMGISSLKIKVEISYVSAGFSADDKYFVMAGKDATLAVDVPSRKEIPLPRDVKGAVQHGFTFISDHQIVANGEVMSFPEGKVERKVELGNAAPFNAADHNFVLLRPIKDYEVGVLDLRSNQIIRASKKPAIDVYGQFAVSELGSGEVGLFAEKAQPIAKVSLPRGYLAPLRAFAAADDLHWLAASSRTRGAVWDLSNGQRVYNVTGFRGAQFDNDGLFVDFPKQGANDRAIARLNMGPTAITLGQKITAPRAQQHGRFLFEWNKKDTTPNSLDEKRDYRYEGSESRWRELLDSDRHDETLEVKDAISGQVLWNRQFKNVPALRVNDATGLAAFWWFLQEPGVRHNADSIPNLNRQAGGSKDNDYLVEVVDLATGKVIGGVMVPTNDGVFSIDDVFVSRTHVAVEDSYGRTLLYPLAPGGIIARAFGRILAMSPTTLVLSRGPGRIVLADAATLTQQQEVVLHTNIAGLRFTRDASRVLVLTRDQTLYGIRVPAVTVTAAAGSK